MGQTTEQLDDVKVRRDSVTAQVSVDCAEARCMVLSVEERDPRSWRRQDLLDLLESDGRFLPARELEGRWVLLSKRSIAWVAHDPDVETGGEGGEGLFDVEHVVDVEFRDGSVMRGALRYAAPPARARVKDFLNEAGRFFRLYRDGRIVVVNKAFVACVREAGEGPAGR